MFPSGSGGDLYDCFYFESYRSYCYESFQVCDGYDTDSYGWSNAYCYLPGAYSATSGGYPHGPPTFRPAARRAGERGGTRLESGGARRARTPRVAAIRRSPPPRGPDWT